MSSSTEWKKGMIGKLLVLSHGGFSANTEPSDGQLAGFKVAVLTAVLVLGILVILGPMMVWARRRRHPHLRRTRHGVPLREGGTFFRVNSKGKLVVRRGGSNEPVVGKAVTSLVKL